jgi:CubicO group peptidase (beta-lactamase class C family)
MKNLLMCFMLGAMCLAQSNKKIDQLVELYASKDKPGLAVEVLQAGKPVYVRTFGVREMRSKAPITATTDFRLASVTKQFTATAIMLLVRDGKLSYETKLTDVFPDFPAYGKQITIRHLLNHTSGLPDYEELMDHAGKTWTAENQISDEEVHELLNSTQKGRFEPGTKWSYSNSGYVVLGLVVAKVSGMSFPDFLAYRIFKPLKMDHTLAYVEGKSTIPERALGHSMHHGKLLEKDQSSTSATLGDGGVYSNLADLAKWDAALANRTLLSDDKMKPALTPFRLADGSFPHWDSGPGDTDPLGGRPAMYGFGWFLDPYKGHKRMWHYGDTTGFQTAIQRFPDDKLTVIVLCDRTDIDPTKIAEQIADLYLATH